ncbi:hypothetical protein [Streptomyces sp. NPDC058695]|uniref:hypothetical protein n=1 Tax=Streptomyces sp. NPDC058695 TaxID=3346604 RepID=UPI0036489F77
MKSRMAVLLGCLVLACASCADAGGEAAVIQQADLVGDWTNSAGAHVHMAGDHTVTASGVDHAVPDYTCPTTVKAARWQFFTRVDSSGFATASDSVTEGDSLVVTVDAGDPDSQWCDLQAAVRRDYRGFNLCLVLDMDQGCTAGELLRRVPAARG